MNGGQQQRLGLETGLARSCPGNAVLSQTSYRSFRHRIDVFGQWLVMFTPKCSKKFGAGPSLHVANQYAQWLDWQGTGTPNNPKVWAALKNYNVTMVMFETDDTHAMRKFEDKYPFDEDGPHGGLPVASAKEWTTAPMTTPTVRCRSRSSTWATARSGLSAPPFRLRLWPGLLLHLHLHKESS